MKGSTGRWWRGEQEGGLVPPEYIYNYNNKNNTHTNISHRKKDCATMLSIYIYFACLSVCLYPLNVKTAKPIGHKFFVGPRATPGKVYGWSNFLTFAILTKFDFWKFWKSRFFYNIREIFVGFCFFIVHKENMFTIEIEDWHDAP